MTEHEMSCCKCLDPSFSRAPLGCSSPQLSECSVRRWSDRREKKFHPCIQINACGAITHVGRVPSPPTRVLLRTTHNHIQKKHDVPSKYPQALLSHSSPSLHEQLGSESSTYIFIMLSLVSVSRCAIAATVAATYMTAVVADYDPIAGYTPVSDVVNHSLLDLDVEEMEAGADLQTTAGFTAAWTAYSEGGNR